MNNNAPQDYRACVASEEWDCMSCKAGISRDKKPPMRQRSEPSPPLSPAPPRQFSPHPPSVFLSLTRHSVPPPFFPSPGGRSHWRLVQEADGDAWGSHEADDSAAGAIALARGTARRPNTRGGKSSSGISRSRLHGPAVLHAAMKRPKGDAAGAAAYHHRQQTHGGTQQPGAGGFGRFAHALDDGDGDGEGGGDEDDDDGSGGGGRLVLNLTQSRPLATSARAGGMAATAPPRHTAAGYSRAGGGGPEGGGGGRDRERDRDRHGKVGGAPPPPPPPPPGAAADGDKKVRKQPIILGKGAAPAPAPAHAPRVPGVAKRGRPPDSAGGGRASAARLPPPPARGYASSAAGGHGQPALSSSLSLPPVNDQQDEVYYFALYVQYYDKVRPCAGPSLSSPYLDPSKPLSTLCVTVRYDSAQAPPCACA